MEDSYGTPTLVVDCREHETAAEIYRALLDEVVDEPSREYADLSRGSLLREVENTLEKPCILALDQADHLEEERILYNAYEKEFLIPVIVVEQRRDLLDGLDERIVSRMSALWPVRFEA
ncbi:ATP-binding protein (plasmid) [Natrinema thermotolerans]|nr:ATP-binding protein [Natrinema thermotolerans]